MPLGVPVSPAPPGSLLSATAVTDTVGGGIVAVSATSPAVLTFAADHGLQTGSTIIVAGTATTPTTVGAFVATVTASNQASIPVAVASVATGTGTATVKALQQQVGVANFPATQPVSGSVSVSNLPGTQPVSGSVSVSNLPATQPVSGTVGVSNFPATQPVSGAFWQATQPVSGTVTANAGTNMSTAALALEGGGNLATIATNTGKIPAQGAALKANSTPVTIATDQPAVPTNAQIGAPLIPTGAASLTISTDGAYTFASQVHHVVVQNNTATAAGVAFDTAATAGSYQVPANSERAFDLACTVLHLFSAAASAVNGTAAANIVVMGAI